MVDPVFDLKQVVIWLVVAVVVSVVFGILASGIIDEIRRRPVTARYRCVICGHTGRHWLRFLHVFNARCWRSS